jgi:hypothetical protein
MGPVHFKTLNIELIRAIQPRKGPLLVLGAARRKLARQLDKLEPLRARGKIKGHIRLTVCDNEA